MARQKKNNDEIEPTKNTKEEIEAALARACGQVPPTQPTTEHTMVEKLCEQTENNAPKIKATNGIDPDGIKLPTINANDCFKTSSENPDNTINDYIVAINSKINKECKSGGYSTNVMIRVIPNQWVNVQHIVDWYRANGFDVSVDEIKQPQYGMGAGSMEYNINISWVNAH